LQRSLSESIANNPSLAQINRTNISTLSTTIQQNLEKAGTKINLRQAEKLAEDLLGEAGSFLRDAVKVVPPDEGSGSYTYSWDGTDVGVYGSVEEGSRSTVLFDRASMAGNNDLSRSQLRLNALLRRLRSDVELLSQDPSAASETRARQDAFAVFKKDKIESVGGYQGQDVQQLVWAEMGPEANDADVETLKKSKDAIGERPRTTCFS
jgi:outer membrane murein-binding lipoprotein Lpp